MDVLEALGIHDTVATNLNGGVWEPKLRTVQIKDVMEAVFQRLMDGWGKYAELNPRDVTLPEGCGRKAVTYASWMANPWEEWSKPPVPAYLMCRSPPDVWRAVARFRTSSHYLRVETGRWQRPEPTWNERTCELCNLATRPLGLGTR